MILALIIALMVVGGFLLAIVSEGFGYAVSRVVEPVFDSIEYRLALRAGKKMLDVGCQMSARERSEEQMPHLFAFPH